MVRTPCTAVRNFWSLRIEVPTPTNSPERQPTLAADARPLFVAERAPRLASSPRELPVGQALVLKM
jgi:hypothetical protein